MEPELIALGTMIDVKTWKRAYSRVDQRLVNLILNSSKASFAVLNQPRASASARKLAWQNLEVLTYALYREIDSSGITSIIAKAAPNSLATFSFAGATSFRQVEENLLQDLNFTALDWGIFWSIADSNKSRLFASMTQTRKFQFTTSLDTNMRATFQLPLNAPVLPAQGSLYAATRRKYAVVLAAAGSIVSAVDTTAAVPSLLVSTASIVAGAAVAAYLAS
jgi:hypothetical protein